MADRLTSARHLSRARVPARAPLALLAILALLAAGCGSEPNGSGRPSLSPDRSGGVLASGLPSPGQATPSATGPAGGAGSAAPSAAGSPTQEPTAAPTPTIEPTSTPGATPSTPAPTPQATPSPAAPTPSPTAAPATPVPSAIVTPSASPSPTSPAPTPSAQAGIVLDFADVPRATPGRDDLRQATASVNGFAVDFIRQAGGDANVVFSPSSIVTALAMARAGAFGTTATEMDSVLHARDGPQLAAAMNALDQAMAGRSGWFQGSGPDPRNLYQLLLSSTNAPFGQVGYPFRDAYLQTLAASYGAGMRAVDYAADPERSRALINGWVAEHTAGRIPALLAAGDVTALTRLILVNAIYFKAPWQNPFEPSETKAGAFTRADRSRVVVPFMHLVSSGLGPTFPAARGTGWAAVRLPYVGGQIAMTIIVPDDLASFEQRLTPALLERATQAGFESAGGGLEDRKVDLTLPRFSVDVAMTLNDPLAALGMPTAFDPASADFSGIADAARAGEAPLYISKVVHDATIDVDEKGTEAAAATAVEMATGGPGDTSAPLVIRADHPFLFVITDVPTGTVLFMGHVGDPAAK